MYRSWAYLNHSDRRFKAQSAMEYLMTYGWAILIIAIVMVALFALGVFNSANFTPRATAGACQVVRNVEGINLEGQCGNEIPQFVLVPGPSGKVLISSTKLSNSYSFSFWFQEQTLSSTNYPTIFSTALGGCVFDSSNTMWCKFPGRSIGIFKPALNTWYNVIGVDDGSLCSVYINGVLTGGAWSCSGGSTISNWTIGPQAAAPTIAIANVQMYNTSLQANDIKSQYMAGIGGVPISPLNVVGWWPLNGDANDYSGSGNNGKASGVSYTSAWTSGYTQP